MLVISRKRDESIIINDDIHVTVIDLNADKVRLGVHTPRETTVHRSEVYEAIMGVEGESARKPPDGPQLASQVAAYLESTLSGSDKKAEVIESISRVIGDLARVSGSKPSLVRLAALTRPGN